MNREDNLTQAQLGDAFQLFNELSQTLAESYGELQAQVEQLSRELARARSERLAHLAEKERIANRLERLLDTLPAGIVVLDRDDRICQANPLAHDMLGEDLHGQAWNHVAQQSFLTDGDELRLHDGRWVGLCVRSLEAEPGKIVLITDTTETHELQAIVSRQQRLTSLGEMIASLAHQIRTPLATAMLYLSNLAHPDARRGDRGHYAEKARDRLHHLERMVNDMLVFARGEVSDTECFDVAGFVEAFRQPLLPQFVVPRAVLSVVNRAPGARLRGNRDALLSAFHNLATNALQAREHGLVLLVTVSLADQDTLTFSFSDNGCGIPDEIRDRVLEPFFTTKTSGTGLGLAVVNATVAAFNGKVDIRSETGAGTSITVTLPLAEKDMMLSSDVTEAGARMQDRGRRISCDGNRHGESRRHREVSL